MLRRTVLLSALLLTMAACASREPHVVQTLPGAPEVHLTAGLATQVELPEGDRVQSVVVGNPAMLTAEQGGGIVNLVAKDLTGETNMIIRTADEDGHTHVYQYRVTVQNR